MSGKRKRLSTAIGRGLDEDDSDSQEASFMEIARKKKRMEPSELLQMLYDTIRNHKKEDGNLLCDAFIRLPKRRQEPQYNEVIANPIDFLKIQQKLKMDEYNDVDELQADFELLTNNAKTFYKKTTQEYKDACDLWDFFLKTKACIYDNDDGESKGLKTVIRVGKSSYRNAGKKDALDVEESSTESWATNTDDELTSCEDLFTSVINATDPEDRALYPAFQLLPSKKIYPNYYDVIENPIDLRMIARKIQDCKYVSLGDMEKDMLLMTKNACIFNEPGSQIYKDAKMLKKIITSKKIEIEHNKGIVEKKSERIRNKRRATQSFSAITAALESEDEDSELEEETTGDDGYDNDSDDPMWQLYNYVRTYTNSQGVVLANSFWKLPSKRYYANYYKEIKNPLSFLKIRKKLKNGYYGTLSEVAGDMNILFENTKKFHNTDTKFYKDALKLQKVMQTKVQELLDFQHEYSNSDDEDDDGGLVEEPPVKKGKTPRLLTRGKYMNNVPLKRKLFSMCKCLMDYMTEDGRQPMLMFMEKPSKKVYPDYYKVISEPIDMLTIENKIKAEKYTNESEILEDFKLMFRNCRDFNEEGSLIYEDANTLESILMEHVKDLDRRAKSGQNANNPAVAVKGGGKKAATVMTPAMTKMRTLYNAIKEYRDGRTQRQLSVIFTKLPSKTEYPDYYEVIKKPIDLDVVGHKLKINAYDCMEELVADLALLFDNACKYNEPDSQIYKDALVLQKVMLQTKIQLKEEEDSVPDVPGAVQELLTSLFTSVYNHQDEEGRCFSDSMAELPEHDEVDGKKVRALSLDLIKRRLDGGQYRRLDMFQDDMFACFERARHLSRTDSQIFEDAIELQSCFIRQRDDLCRNGDLLNSPALIYSFLDLSQSVNASRESKLPEEQLEGDDGEVKIEDEKREDDDSSTEGGSDIPARVPGALDNAMSYNQQVYRVGDFVYAEPKERGNECLICNIQRLWINQENQPMMFGNQYYRPSETYHVRTRKFLENEVFKTDQHLALPLSSIKGRCAVLNVKDYFKMRPEGFEDKDVYVCESRYISKGRTFKKIKNWPSTLSVCKLVEREVVLEPKRNVSVYRDRVEKHKEEIAELEEQEKLVEKPKPNIEALHLPLNAEESCTYYEQYNALNCLIRTGDCVYLSGDNKTSRTLICQIHKIWTNKEGQALIHGPWLVLPSDIPHTSNRQFYKQEILLSVLENTNQVSQIIGKCAVLEFDEYISNRPTEIPESEVYICESTFDELRQCIVELPKDGLKKFVHGSNIFQDEIFFFRRLLNPTKLFAGTCCVVPKIEPPDMHADDSMDGGVGGPPSVSSCDLGAPSTPNNAGNSTSAATSTTKKKGKEQKSKIVTGYILYSSEMRKGVTLQHQGCTFGEVSRIVGNDWKKLSLTEKNAWEEKAVKMNKEAAVKFAEEQAEGKGSGQQHPQQHQQQTFEPTFIGPLQVNTVWECHWDGCDYMFEDQIDCLEHAITDNTGHVASSFAGIPPSGAEYQCQWKGCLRLKKNVPPFPSLHRLIRHVKEVHILKSSGRVVHPQDRSKHVILSRNRKNVATPQSSPATTAAATSQASGTTTANNGSASGKPVTNTAPKTIKPNEQSNQAESVANRPQDPIFVSIPPTPHRIEHSDIYLKYIQGLSEKAGAAPKWEKELRARPDTVPPPDPNKLPVHWLGNGVGNHGSAVNALWALREYMLQDALNISRAYPL